MPGFDRLLILTFAGMMIVALLSAVFFGLYLLASLVIASVLLRVLAVIFFLATCYAIGWYLIEVSE